jgi:hypothetical protein
MEQGRRRRCCGRSGSVAPKSMRCLGAHRRCGRVGDGGKPVATGGLGGEPLDSERCPFKRVGDD